MQMSPFDEILCQGCAVVQKVSCWRLTAEGRTSVQVSLCGRQRTTGNGLSPSTSVSAASIIPPMLVPIHPSISDAV